MTAIRIEQLCYRYRSGGAHAAPALHDVSCTIPAGTSFGVAGCSGSGKSTLLLLLAGVLEPTGGRVVFAGPGPAAVDPLRGGDRIGLLPQHPQHDFFETTVAREIGFALAGEPLGEDERERRVRQALHQVGLRDEFLAAAPLRLSAGEQRRVALAGVLVRRPAFLLLDEPTAGLDPQGRRELLALLGRLRREARLTLIVASHRSEELAELSEGVIVLQRGRLVRSGATRTLLDDPEGLAGVGLEAPRMALLMAALRRHWPELPPGVLTVAEAHRAVAAALSQRTGGGRDVA